MKKIISIMMAGVLVVGSVAIAVSALDQGDLSKDVSFSSVSGSGAFVGSVMQKESGALFNVYYEVPGTGEKLPIKVMTMTTRDDDDDRLEAEPKLALQITSLNAILDETRTNGISKESADLTRRLYAALVQAGSLEAFMNTLPEGSIEGLDESGFNAANRTVFAMFNLQPNAALRAKLAEGGKLSFQMAIPGMTAGTSAELMFMDSMTTGMMLDPAVAEESNDYDEPVIDVVSPTLGTLFVTVSK